MQSVNSFSPGGAYYLNGYLYGLFSGPTSVIETGSVLCRFSMDEITRVFEGKAKYFAFGKSLSVSTLV